MASLLASPSPALSLLSSTSRSLPFQFTHVPTRRGRLLSPCANDLHSGHWREQGAKNLRRALESLEELRDALPQPVRAFPWRRASAHFVLTLADLFSLVAKYLSVPVLALSSISDMSYCAYKRSMGSIPVPFLLGITFAWIARRTAVDVAPELSEGAVPWHLVAMGAFFFLLKLLGPYYPYLGRLLVPHFANGGLWYMLWFVYRWRGVGGGQVEVTKS